MKTNFISIFIFLAILYETKAQTVIQGKITGEKNEALTGVNVFLKNTFDGTSTDTTGFFKFTTTETVEDTLVISFIGFQTITQKINLQSASSLTFKLKEEANELNTVVITAGSFEASDDKKMVMLRPLDIYRTAGSGGDVYGALQTLPGTQRSGDKEGLFVRGGSGNETQTLMDGMIVQNPFYSATPDIAQRGRFSPNLFKGTAFSTGGYSAQYGQALSSVLALNTTDLPDESELNIFTSFLFGSIAATKRWENTSLMVSGGYTNLGLAVKLIPQNIAWTKAPEGYGSSIFFKQKTSETGIFKVFANYEHSAMGMDYSKRYDGGAKFDLRNNNFYSNASYQDFFGKWTVKTGFSYSQNQDNIGLSADKVLNKDNRFQGRLVLVRDIFKNSNILFGTEVHYYDYETGFNELKTGFDEVYAAFFTEAEIYITRKLAGRIGVRTENSRLLNEWNIAPRISLAYKTGDYSQVSFATGHFYQSPYYKYLFSNTNLHFEKAVHYIANYQWMKNEQTFRIEAYYKDYQSLLRELNQTPFNPDPNRFPTGNTVSNGNGYAQGFDVFWKDNKTFKSAEYWVSYSYLDTKRLFQNYTEKAMPTFASNHNVSIAYKHFITAWSLDVNATYSYASGRPYYNPQSNQFLKDRTPDYHNLSVSLHYITEIKGNQTVFILQMNNVLATKNVYGYRYSEDGTQRFDITLGSYFSFFAGISITIK
jgi:hypothetical protein